jgi:hypothetical protein
MEGDRTLVPLPGSTSNNKLDRQLLAYVYHGYERVRVARRY